MKRDRVPPELADDPFVFGADRRTTHGSDRSRCARQQHTLTAAEKFVTSTRRERHVRARTAPARSTDRDPVGRPEPDPFGHRGADPVIRWVGRARRTSCAASTTSAGILPLN